ncbi:MAG: phosphoribosylglycinamide formyltransferase [Actinomycetota bacterium]|nr:phosphoribosylglycinamide formyltransferase [Actinomycetota bacterium]
MARVAVLVSGTGTILRSVVEAGIPVSVVLADRPCPALALASEAGVEAVLCDRREFGGFGPAFDRQRYTEALARALRVRGVDLVAMAGFGTVLGTQVHAAFPGRILNTHPSLLPAFPGWHAVADALSAGVTTTGCTVHVAIAAVDAGPVLAQEEVAVLPGDSEAALHERIKEVERRIYPATILRVLAELGRAGDAASAVDAATMGSTR